ncbi:Heme oxygenase [Noviherbaspirillum humi]|uniref:Heme oxygenase n=1 Tax=Noviherbaspirillum humi TaxID=1688639 RepID=A0A239HEI2_9BURK|nr:biliverdin-producing heme oxygenase [Noviherbaspirillum humi]SNS79428.1 Heme oxygenase [Noviherbaspirillum humi]
MPARPALEALRAATRQAHDDLETHLAIARPGAGAAEYHAYLKALWGWMAPFEERLWTAPWPATIEAPARNGKRHWIAEDLRRFDIDERELTALPGGAFTPDLTSAAARFGLAYVIEGSQLGTQVIRKNLEPALAPWNPRWLQGYGPETGRRWRDFTDAIEMHLDDDEARRIAAEAAKAAFRSLAEWFRT